MLPLHALTSAQRGHKTWRATLPSYSLIEVVDNLLYPSGDTASILGIYLNRDAIKERIANGDTLPPEDVDVTSGYPLDEEAERVVAWLHNHPETWANYGPLRLTQWKLKQGSNEFNLSDSPATFLPHFLLAAAMIRMASIEVEIVFGSLETVHDIIDQLSLPEDAYSPLPESLLFGERFFPADNHSPEGFFLTGPFYSGSRNLAEYELLDFLSAQTVGKYSPGSWWVGFEEPADRPPSKLGAKMAQGMDEPPEYHVRGAGVSEAQHLADFISQAETFLGDRTSGFRDYMTHTRQAAQVS